MLAMTRLRQPISLKLSLAGLSLLTLLFFSGAPPVAAQSSSPSSSSGTEFTPEVPIPGLFQGSQTIDNNLAARYIRAIYVYFIWIVGILATIMVIFGGIKWIGAAGNPGQINDARETVNNAIIGIIIALTSVVLLNIINPDFVNFSLPGLTSQTTQYVSGVAVTKICAPTLKVSCGSLLKTGTTVDINNKIVGEFCMGTICDFGGAAGFNQKNHVCSIDKNPSTGYYLPRGGCLADVPITPLGGDYQGISTLQAADDATLRPDLFCGHAYSDLKIAGSQCANRPNETYYNDKNTCYFLGSLAQITDRTGNDDLIKNAFCPES